MADITRLKRNIQVEETDFRSAVSESVLQKVGGSVNFINDRQYDTKGFFLNGKYGTATVPMTAIDGLYVFPFDAEIFNVYMFNIVAGSGGTTELDIKRLTDSGGSPTSIFSTTPKIASTAGARAYVGVGESGAGLTAPVLSGGAPFDVNAGDAVYVDLIQKQTGDPENCGVILYLMPR
jgi:hypothetical protein